MLSPSKAKAWDYSAAAHLLNRAAFGGSPEEIEALWKLGRDPAVESLLNAPDDSAAFPQPPWARPVNKLEERALLDLLTEEERRARRRAIQKGERAQVRNLVAWWVGRMRQSANPCREKMTLFWHGHFATSSQKVREPYYLWLQNETFRGHALGNFGALTKAVVRDPAMLLYLDGDKSRALRPNENFARELMELFTLGIGHYTEADVREAARAFTGYRVNPASQASRFAPLQHDDGEKTILGHKGPFDGDGVVDLLLRQPACAPFLARKWLAFFMTDDEPPRELVDALARELVQNRYEIRPTLRTLFRSEAFYSPAARRSQIKSPVQWIVGTSKALETAVPPEGPLFSALRELGQVPFLPPNVKGWDGGKNWITTSTLLARYNLASLVAAGMPRAIRRGGPPPGERLLEAVPPGERQDPRALVARLALRVFQAPLAAKDLEPFAAFAADHPPTPATVESLLSLMMSTPQFQLA